MKNSLSLKTFLREKRGMTLIELSIVVAMTVIFLLAAVAVMIVGYRNWHINRAVITLNDDLVNGLRSMVRELREAGAVSPNGIQILAPAESGIKFELPNTVGPSGPTSWRWIQYGLGGSDGRQIIRTDANGARVLATNVANLNFHYHPISNPREVAITVTGSKQAANGTMLSQVVSMEVTVRN